MIIFKIGGTVKEKESGVPIPGLFVKAYDKDLLFDDLMGTAFTDRRGRFDIVSELTDFRDFFEVRPDIYFKIYKSDQTTLLHSTEEAVRWKAGRFTEVEIRIPHRKVFPPGEVRVALTSGDGEGADRFEVGGPLRIAATGLRPIAPYEVEVMSEGRELFSNRLLTNGRGEIEPSILWPQMGMDDPNSNVRYTFEQARRKWQGRSLDLTIKSGGEAISKQQIRFADSFSRPFLMSTDQEGRLLNGYEIGQQPLYISAHNLPFTGPARIFMVARHYDWNLGDAFEPATLADGRPAIRDITVEENRRDLFVEFASPDELLPGAYDFIIRPIRYGYEEDEERHLKRTDIVGSRWATGVVIRERFRQAKPVLGGCVNKIPISGRTIVGAPYFQYADTFEIGENIYAALDPGAVDPNNLGKMCAYYVVPDKSTAQWNADNSLNHLPILGGNAGVIKILMQSGCINHSKTLVWPNAMQPGDYDIVADFGNNTANAATFVPNSAYDTPLDIIDGYFVTGFRVVEDPGTLQEFVNAGNFSYDENDVNMMGLQGTVTVEDEAGSYATPGMYTSVNVTVSLRARVYFPADMPGVTDPTQISASNPNYPLIVIIHGNGHSYLSYDFLLEHFAKNGFIAASIHLNGGMSGLGRANIFFKHVPVLAAKFGVKMQNNIGIMGHSRGGEGVVKAARLNQQLALGHNINAIISLAPTDQYGKENLSGAWTKPYFVLYGSRDGDIYGDIWTGGYTALQTGFALYDRANGSKKSFAFVYKASHNGFITTNYDAWPGDAPVCLTPTVQQTITKAYMNAFFRWQLRNEDKWDGMFKGEWKPSSVEQTGAELYSQFQDTVRDEVDNFEGVHSAVSWQTSTIGGTVTHNGTLPVDPQENELHAIDAKSPHDTGGLKLRWDNLTDRLEFSVPLAHKNVSSYTTLSLRVSQVTDSVQNPANQPQNLRVALKDGSGNERAVRVSPFSTIPYPDVRSSNAYTKSAMNTIRIPLKCYSIVCAGQVQVDLTDIVKVSFAFSEKTSGELDIDSVEFTN